jgi:hypothetical protein
MEDEDGGFVLNIVSNARPAAAPRARPTYQERRGHGGKGGSRKPAPPSASDDGEGAVPGASTGSPGGDGAGGPVGGSGSGGGGGAKGAARCVPWGKQSTCCARGVGWGGWGVG